MALIEIVEGMEKFLLRGVLAGDELDIIDEEEVRAAVFEAELVVFAFAQGVDEFVCKLVSLDVDDVVVRVVLMNFVRNGIEKVRLPNAGRAVDEKWIIRIRGLFRNGDGGGVRKLVAVADDEVIERKLRVKFNEARLLFGRAIGFDFRIVEHDEL